MRVIWRFGAAVAAAGVLAVVGLLVCHGPAVAEPKAGDAGAKPSGGEVRQTLTADGRVGVVVDAQGLVSVKPLTAARWTPVEPGMLVRPGDWVRTDIRGAHAATLRLLAPAEIVVGPGSLVELVTPRQLRVHYGEVRIDARPDASIELLGPDGGSLAVAKRTVYRVKDSAFVALDSDPLWLKSYEGKLTNESLGSLIANVDGRIVPLTVGYHKVTVDIRDQIARTTVEESFVNHTNQRLEGVFHFPLPQDASISGFGMWIGGELIEADIVEKQRAREIFEEILREERDPALLEWAGGNLFKARVFPIEPHSEKRIKITYTQVLPLRTSGYRYSYALHSELLRQHPLRELQIDVRVHSALPLRSVTSPTHPVRIHQAGHSAHVEFAAQEYTPAQDFEVRVDVDAQGRNVVLVPHRRGDDGYFLLLLTPPASADPDPRDLLPEGEPLELLLLADTSASMTARQRAVQGEFLTGLLGSLGARDTFNLAVCDVDCGWLFGAPVPATPENIAAVRDHLAGRPSLGWSDLDKAFASVLERSGPKTHVIYVGDGVPTTTDADPVAFANRLRRMYAQGRGTFHAVSVGSTYESGVLAAIASLGGGSARCVDHPQKVGQAVRELLGEIARPPLRDLRVEFTGLRTARVYPERLPNLPAGTQQVVLGRYLPEGEDQQGEVLIRGTREGKPVEFRTHVSLADAESGNSFIPRLWARMHLDSLLQQGASQSIQDEIVALSDEYHIITPYTSLLVLESDADRARFGVKRRFLMRDGERFFAEGRDSADFALRQQQMKHAGTWRIALRRSVLEQLGTLGRDTRVFQPAEGLGWGSWGRTTTGGMVVVHPPVAEEESGGLFGGGGDSGTGGCFGSSGDSDADDAPLDESGESLLYGSTEQSVGDDGGALPDPVSEGDPLATGEALEPGPATLSDAALIDAQASGGAFLHRGESESKNSSSLGLFGGTDDDSERTDWVDALFPEVPEAEDAASPAVTDWPQEAKRISENLLRTREWATLSHVRVERRSEDLDPRTGQARGREESLLLRSPKAWLRRYEEPLGWSLFDSEASFGGQTAVEWCDGQQRAVFVKGFLLGRTRPAESTDMAYPGPRPGVFALHPIEQSHADDRVRVEPLGEGRVQLVLEHPSWVQRWEDRVVIDTERWVVLRIESYCGGRLTETLKCGKFVEVGGAWWPTLHETFDADNRRLAVTTEAITVLEPDEFDRHWRGELSEAPKVQLLQDPPREVARARAAVSQGRADFDDRFALVLHALRLQRWEQAFEHLAAAELAAGDKPGLRYVRNALLKVSRRHQPLRDRLLQQTDELVRTKAPSPEDLPLVKHLLDQAEKIMGHNEVLELLDRMAPVFRRQEAHTRAMEDWTTARIRHLEPIGRSDEAFGLCKQLAEQYPEATHQQTRYAGKLAEVGRVEDALTLLRKAIDAGGWTTREEEQLRREYADLLESHGRMRDLPAFIREWMERDLPDTQAYARHLSALIRLDRIDESERTMERWLADGRAPNNPTLATTQRLQAAVAHALGEGHGMDSQRMDDRWMQPLADTAIALVAHPEHAAIAGEIMRDWTFRRTDAARTVRQAALDTLLADLAKLTPSHVGSLVDWVIDSSFPVEKDTWRKLATDLSGRWARTPDPREKDALGWWLASVAKQLGSQEHVAFLRILLREGPQAYRSAYARQLFKALIDQPHSPQHEDEAFALLEQLSDDPDPAKRFVASVAALCALDDWMEQGRFDASMEAIPHPEKLTRTELRTAEARNLRLARQAVADRLGQEAKTRSGPLVAWLQAERIHFDVLAGRNLAAATEQAWDLLQTDAPADDVLADLHAVLHDRMLLTLANLACRRSAPPELAERLLKHIGQAIAQDEDDPQWKLRMFELLVALDRPQELQRALEGWIAAGDPDDRWTIARGYVLAEQGRVEPAVEQFEAIAAAGGLEASDLHALANWYMVLDRRDRYERARIDAYRATDEWLLADMLGEHLWEHGKSGDPPAEMDPQVLLIFAALFEMAEQPEHHIELLEDCYTATRDFRLLTGLADAVIGHTPERIYAFLKEARGVLEAIQDEATCDSVVAHIATVRRRAGTDVDRRALDLLELLVERRSAELLNQPGAHAERALGAMRRAFEHTWSEGEPRLMAELLVSMEVIFDANLAAERRREFEALHRMAKPGSEERLYVAHAWAKALVEHDGRDILDVLSAALDEHQAAHDGMLPVSANAALGWLVEVLSTAGHHARAESILQRPLQRPAHPQQELWLTLRLYEVYARALSSGGQVSLGSGGELYKAVEHRLRADVASSTDRYRGNFMKQLCDLYRRADAKRIEGVADDVRAFAFERVPQVLDPQTGPHSWILSLVAEVVRDVVGRPEALAFLVERIAQEPAWFRLNNDDGWYKHAYLLGELCSSPPADAELERRLLAIVLEELRYDLRTGVERRRVLYGNDRGHFWGARKADFLRTAEEVYAERKTSQATVRHIAAYLFADLSEHDRAIEMLQIALREDRLDKRGQSQLVSFLHRRNRNEESIPLLRQLVQRYPEDVEYRVTLMKAYFHAGANAALVELLDQTDEYFRQEGRWGDYVLRKLAESAMETEHYERAVAYYEKLIAFHQEDGGYIEIHPRMFASDETLSRYYSGLARAYSALGRTADATNAACAAIVCWGSRSEKRAEVIDALLDVIRAAKDLDALVAELDRQAAQTGLHKPIVRKAIGTVYTARDEFPKAIAQLKLAVELQPDDLEAHQALVLAYDLQDDTEGAIAQLLQSVQWGPREIELYADLARHYEDLNRPEDAERAYTSIVEVLPNESESHTALAEIRQDQDRWSDAIEHWRQVVRIRSLEPTGLLRLAYAQIELKQRTAAAETLQQLRSRTWPALFENTELEIGYLVKRLERLKTADGADE